MECSVAISHVPNGENRQQPASVRWKISGESETKVIVSKIDGRLFHRRCIFFQRLMSRLIVYYDNALVEKTGSRVELQPCWDLDLVCPSGTNFTCGLACTGWENFYWFGFDVLSKNKTSMHLLAFACYCTLFSRVIVSPIHVLGNRWRNDYKESKLQRLKTDQINLS